MDSAICPMAVPMPEDQHHREHGSFLEAWWSVLMVLRLRVLRVYRVEH